MKRNLRKKGQNILPIAVLTAMAINTIGIPALPQAFAAEAGVNLNVGSVESGNILKVDVQVTASDLYGADVGIAFDAAKLEVVDQDSNAAGIQVTPGGFGGSVVVNEADNSEGKVRFVTTLLGERPGMNAQDLSLYTVTFKVKDGATGDFGIRTEKTDLISSANEKVPGSGTTNPGSGSGTGGGSTSGTGGGAATPAPATQPQTQQPVGQALPKVEFTAAQIQSAVKDGKISLSLPQGKGEVVLPSNLNELVGENKLEIKTENLTLSFPKEVLTALVSLAAKDALADSKISVTVNPMEKEAVQQILSQAKLKEKAELVAAGQILDLNLSIVGKDGKATSLEKFQKPVTIELSVDAKANQKLTGIYYIQSNGQLEYVGGKYINGKLVADIDHFSQYGVLEYNKTFTDVPAGFWASPVIKELAAKHIISGVSDTEYAPNKSVTRAEFSALLVRALGLKATKTADFEDVAPDKWYAKEIAAASEAGIVQGKGKGKFAPEATITRQEMVAMLVKAYELKSGNKLAASKAASFKDMAKVSAWAKESVAIAVEQGLVKGRTADEFSPQGKTTRAESAQVIYNLLIK